MTTEPSISNTNCLTLSVVINLHKELIHAGCGKMLAVMCTRVYWKQMTKQVAEFIKRCRICHFKHLKNNKYPQMCVKPPLGPGLRFAIDCWTGGGQSALTVINLHSQYPFAKPLPDKSAKSVCNAQQNILAFMCKPLEILSDNWGEFVNDSMSRLLDELQINIGSIQPSHKWNC